MGNFYGNLFDNASHVAAHALETEERLLRRNLVWNHAVYKSGLPLPLRHLLLNSLATFVKTGVWTADGRWRQYESFSCNDLEPVHIHGYRSLALSIAFPDLVYNLLDTGWAVTQMGCELGYVPETLGNGNLSTLVPDP